MTGHYKFSAWHWCPTGGHRTKETEAKSHVREEEMRRQSRVINRVLGRAFLSAMVIFGPLVIASLLRFGCTSMKLHFRPISLFEKTINPDVIEGKLTLQKRRAKENCAGIHDNFVLPSYLLWCSKLLVTREPWLSIDRSIGFAWSGPLSICSLKEIKYT